MKSLFEQNELAGIPLKNRLIRSATHEAMADEAGRPREQLARLYERLSRGGIGAIISGFLGVHRQSHGYPHMMLLDRDEHIPDYQALLEPTKKQGTPVIAQVAHLGGKFHASMVKSDVLAPSTKNYAPFGVKARAMTPGDIEETIDAFVQAIRRCREAGFDGVQVHAAHGYLLSEFLSPHCNRRTDSWGGDTERRFRIVGEIMRGARQEVGDYPLLLKISGHDWDKNGMTVPEAIKLARLFQEAGGDAVEVSSGGVNALDMSRTTKIPVEAILNLDPQYTKYHPVAKKILAVLLPLGVKNPRPIYNYNVEAAARIKEQLDIPVIVVGGLRKLDEMEQVITEGKADYVALCRPLIIEPALVENFLNGKQDRSKCIDCDYCLLGVLAGPLRCYMGKLPG